MEPINAGFVIAFVIIGVVTIVGLVLLFMAIMMVVKAEREERDGDWLVPTTNDSPGRQVEVLSKLHTKKKVSKWRDGEQVLFLDPMRIGRGYNKCDR